MSKLNQTENELENLIIKLKKRHQMKCWKCKKPLHKHNLGIDGFLNIGRKCLLTKEKDDDDLIFSPKKMWIKDQTLTKRKVGKYRTTSKLSQ